MKHFKKTTLGHAVIMGRKTYESLGEPLTDRKNIVLSRNKNYECSSKSIFIFDSLTSALKNCEENGYKKIFIIGGEELFHEGINFIDEMIISHLNDFYPGDAYFPEIDSKVWVIVNQLEEENYKIITYRRKTY